MGMYKVKCTVAGKEIDITKNHPGAANESKVMERLRKIGFRVRVDDHHYKYYPFHAIDLVEIEKIPEVEVQKIREAKQKEDEAKREKQQEARLEQQKKAVQEKVRRAEIEVKAKIAAAQGATPDERPVAGKPTGRKPGTAKE